MRTNNINIANKINSLFFCYLLFFLVYTNSPLFAQGFTFIDEINSITTTGSTGEKPQNKIWEHGGYWWAVIPVSSPAGTHLWRLDGNSWTRLIQLSTATNINADCLAEGDTAYVLLYNNSSSGSEFLKLRFQSNTYSILVSSSLNLASGVETATVAMDSQRRAWVAYDGGANQIYVKYSNPPLYNTWTTTQLAFTGTTSDDICAITAFGGNKIGVLWSAQSTEVFRFRFRNDSDPLADWEIIEQAASGTFGAGVADDHINFAVDSRDGTIYAAVKTSYDANNHTRLGLLVRRPNNTWDPMYEVSDNADDAGTRPIVLLNEIENIITVFYQEEEGDGDIVYKESALNPISFPVNYNYLTYRFEEFANVTSLKESVNNDPVILFSNSGSTSLSYTWSGIKLNRSDLDIDNGAGYAINFSGTDNIAVRMRDGNNLIYIGNAITLEAWVKPDNYNFHTIIHAQDDPEPQYTDGYELILTDDQKIRFTIDQTELNSVSDYTPGIWTHIAAAYDGTRMRIYINGIEDASILYSAGINDHSAQFLIGARSLNGANAELYDRVFDGSLDEIRVWNVARDINDIRTFMCRKLDDSNFPASLLGYWRFDNPEGLTIGDLTANNNYGTLYNSGEFFYEWSGAPLGDDSEFDYTSSGGNFVQQIDYPGADYMVITASESSGAEGIQVYRVDAPASRPSIGEGIFPESVSPFTNISPLRYYGIKVFGSGTPTYDMVYHYTGHPGIFDESDLELVFRDNLFDDTWEDLNAVWNSSEHTLSKTGLTGTEFALASNSNPLPVELAYFTGSIVGRFVKLSWKTETEVSNYGFEVQKSEDRSQESEWNTIGFVEGHGNSNSPKLYSYSDPVDEISGKIYYRLKQIDNDGAYSYSNIISVQTGLPFAYELYQNYPNPFNPSTNIRFQIPEKSFVNIKVYNSIGEQVDELLNEEKEAGYYEVTFRAANLSSGVYVYTISAGTYFSSRKMILLQ